MRARAALVAAVIVLGTLLALVVVRGGGDGDSSDRPLASSSGSSPGPGSQLTGSAPGDSSVLEVAVEDDAAPWSQRDGSGYANDVVLAAFQAVGVQVHLQVVPYSRCKQMVVEGQVAVCFSMSRLPGLERDVVFSENPIFVCHSDLMQRAADPHPISGPRDLKKGTVLGIVNGYEYPPELYVLEREGLVVFEPSMSEEINLRKLADGRLDAAMVNLNETKTMEYMLAKAGLASKLRLGFTIGDLPAFVGFSRHHPGAQAARLSFEEGRRAIAADGTLAKIERAWAERALAQVAEQDSEILAPALGPGRP